MSKHRASALNEVTEYKRVPETPREAEERFHSAFSYATIGMALVGNDGRWLQVDHSLCEVVGYSDEALLLTMFRGKVREKSGGCGDRLGDTHAGAHVGHENWSGRGGKGRTTGAVAGHRVRPGAGKLLLAAPS